MWTIPERRETARWSFSSVVWILPPRLLAVISWALVSLPTKPYQWRLHFTMPWSYMNEYTASGLDDRACGWTQQLIQNIQTIRAYGRTWESRRGTLQEHNIGFLSESRMLVAGFVLIRMLRWAVKWANRDRWDHYLYASLWNVISDMLDDYTAVITRSHTQVTSHLPSPWCPFLPYILN